MVLDVVVVEQLEVLGERGFQASITLSDVQRVRVVLDIEKVSHRGLAGVGTIVNSQLAHIGDLPTEIGCWRPVHHTACRHCVLLLELIQ